MDKKITRSLFIEDMFQKIDNIPIESIIGSHVYLIPRGRHLTGLCPFHRGTHLGNFMVTPSKGLWKCFSCDDGYAGNGIKFISLYMNMDYLEAAFHIAREYNVISYDEYLYYSDFNAYSKKEICDVVRKHQETSMRVETYEKASPEIIDAVYLFFKGQCKLSEASRKYLLGERTLNEERMKADYFDFPTVEKDKIVNNILKQFPEVDLCTVPGFFYNKDKQKYDFLSSKGIGFLIRDDNSRLITAIQIRRTTIKVGESRYIWFSSSFALGKDNLKGGASSGAPKDILFPKTIKNKTVCITEGRFKSEKILEFGNICISVQGVSSWKGIERNISSINVQHELKRIYIMYDADMLNNYLIFEQAIKMSEQIKKNCNLPVSFVLWREKLGKGIDDLIINGNLGLVKYMDSDEVSSLFNSAISLVLDEFNVESVSNLTDDEKNIFRNSLQLLLESFLQLPDQK